MRRDLPSRARSEPVLTLGLLAAVVLAGCGRPPGERLAEALLAERLSSPTSLEPALSKLAGAPFSAAETHGEGPERVWRYKGSGDGAGWIAEAGVFDVPGGVEAAYAIVGPEARWAASPNPQHLAFLIARTAVDPLSTWMEHPNWRPPDPYSLVWPLQTWRLDPGHRWALSLVRKGAVPLFLAESRSGASAGTPVPYAAFYVRATDPRAATRLVQMAEHVIREVGRQPEGIAFSQTHLDSLLAVNAPAPDPALAEPDPDAEAPVEPRAEVDGDAIAHETVDRIPARTLAEDRALSPERTRRVRILLSPANALVGACVEVLVRGGTGHCYLGGWFRSSETGLIEKWRRYLYARSRQHPIRLAPPAFLPRPWWWKPPGEQELTVDAPAPDLTGVDTRASRASYRPAFWSETPTAGWGIGFRADGTIEYYVEATPGKTPLEDRVRRDAIDPATMKPVFGFPVLERGVSAPFFDGRLSDDGAALRLAPAEESALFQAGPLFLGGDGEIGFNALAGQRPSPWGESVR